LETLKLSGVITQEVYDEKRSELIELKALHTLKAAGLLSEAEFERKSAALN